MLSVSLVGCMPTKVRLVKAMVFPVVMYGCESWTVKKAEGRRIDAFELWCWIILLNPSSTVKLKWNDWNSKRLQLMNLVLFGLCNIGNRILLSPHNCLVISEDVSSLKKTFETVSENTLFNS